MYGNAFYLYFNPMALNWLPRKRKFEALKYQRFKKPTVCFMLRSKLVQRKLCSACSIKVFFSNEYNKVPIDVISHSVFDDFCIFPFLLPMT